MGSSGRGCGWHQIKMVRMNRNHCNLRCTQPCTGALQQPLPTPTYQGGHLLRHHTGGPNPYLLPAVERSHAIPLHQVLHWAVGPSPFGEGHSFGPPAQ